MDQSSGDSLVTRPNRREWRRPGIEGIAVFAAFLAYLIFQLHAAAFHGYWGQDWISHSTWISEAAAQPWEFLTHYSQARTNPPVYHLLGGVIKRIGDWAGNGPWNFQFALGLLNVAFGLATMCLVYAMIRRFVESPFLRIACLVFILFLPFAMIHAQVIAADALATPLFWLILWLVVDFRADRPSRLFSLWIAGISFLLIAGLFVKFTFASLLVAATLWLGLLLWTRILPSGRIAVTLVAVVLLPAMVAYLESVQYRSQQHNSLGISELSMPRLFNAEMTPRSILWLRPADRDVLSAPAYNWMVGGQYDLLQNNRHSYPALLHLAMFTDILNIYQFDPYDSYFGERTILNQGRMRTAVLSGIVFSLLAITAVVVLLIRSFASVLFLRNPRDLGILAMLLFCVGWFLSLVAVFPFIPKAYFGGYWLPRLTAPALIGFFLAGFVFLDRYRRLTQRWHVIILIAVVLQSGLHASFLWPHRSASPLYEPDTDVKASSIPLIRVFNWQDGTKNQKGEYWLDRTMGIVVNRPDTPGDIQNWSLSFTVSPGPANPASHRVLRVSSRYLAPTIVESDGTTAVRLEMPLAPGRNDIRVDLVAPERTVEFPGDALVRMVRISGIKCRPSGAANAAAVPK